MILQNNSPLSLLKATTPYPLANAPVSRYVTSMKTLRKLIEGYREFREEYISPRNAVQRERIRIQLENHAHKDHTAHG